MKLSRANFFLTTKSEVVSQAIGYDPIDGHIASFPNGGNLIPKYFFSGRVPVDESAIGNALGQYSFPLLISFLVEASGSELPSLISFYGRDVRFDVEFGWIPWATLLAYPGNSTIRSTRYYSNLIPLTP